MSSPRLRLRGRPTRSHPNGQLIHYKVWPPIEERRIKVICDVSGKVVYRIKSEITPGTKHPTCSQSCRLITMMLWDTWRRGHSVDTGVKKRAATSYLARPTYVVWSNPPAQSRPTIVDHGVQDGDIPP